MSNGHPVHDQTFLGKFREDLENSGMFPDMAQAVIRAMLEGEKSSSMAGRWMDDPAGYPAVMYNVLWALLKTYALTYIDKHAPAAWFRPVFLPVAEQTKFLEECRSANRPAEAKAADPAGVLYKNVGTVTGQYTSKDVDNVLGGDSDVRWGLSGEIPKDNTPNLDVLVSISKLEAGLRAPLYPHQKAILSHVLKTPVATADWPAKPTSEGEGK